MYSGDWWNYSDDPKLKRLVRDYQKVSAAPREDFEKRVLPLWDKVINHAISRNILKVGPTGLALTPKISNAIKREDRR